MQALIIATTNILKQYSARKFCCFKMWGCGWFSDVICVLLLSGLQKDDLDANTLEKLRRHNVNIYDMNNESLRQECLLKTYLNTEKSTKAFEVTEDPNDVSIKPINKQTYPADRLNVADIRKSEIAAPENFFVDKTNTGGLVDEIKIKGVIQREDNRRDDIKTSSIMVNNPDNINVTFAEENKDQIQYIKNQPSLESVMKFWAKLANKAKSEPVTATATTYETSPSEQEIYTTASNFDNKGYVHSREMEYINRIIAEYLGSQTVPTTTQVSRKKKTSDIITKKINELLAKNIQIESTVSPINIENTFDTHMKALSELKEFGRIIPRNNNDDVNTAKPVLISQKVNNYDNIEQVPMAQVMPYSSLMNFSPKTLDNKSIKKMQALEFLNDMLKIKNEYNTPLSFMEPSTQFSVINIDNQDDNEAKKDVKYYTKYPSNRNKDLAPVQITRVANDQIRGVPEDVIQVIAEKVKEIVMKDIIKEISTTEEKAERSTTSLTTTTTMAPTTAARETEKPKTPRNETNEGSVIQKLMEMFRELKTVKDAAKTTDMPVINTFSYEQSTYRNQPLDRMYPPMMAGLNPYAVKPPNAKRIEIDPYKQNLAPVPFGHFLLPTIQEEPKHIPQQNNYQKNEYRLPPITLQTNSAEIPPLAIQISKPIKLINQHIIVTTQNPFEKQREEQLQQQQRESKQRFSDKYTEYKDKETFKPHHIDNPTYADLTKKLRIAENVKQDFRESYKDRLEKLKERIKFAHEQKRDKGQGLSHPLEIEDRLGLNRPTHHGAQIIGSGHHDSLKRLQDSNPRATFKRPVDINNHEILNRPRDNHRETLNQPVNMNHRESLNQPLDSSYRDIITREFLSRLVDSDHHDVISQLVQSSAHRPVDLDHQSRSHQSDAYERYQHERSHPRYKSAKFHEELERPQNSYEAYRMTTENCCGAVATRQQMPLTKVKERPRFDDTHFRNFLKSQQKVTDMLERILAAKSKARSQSAEMPQFEAA